MSDTFRDDMSSSESEVEEMPSPPPVVKQVKQKAAAKPKRQLTQLQLDKLAIARQKANKVRAEKADVKRKEKELARLQNQAKSKQLDDQIREMSAPPPAPTVNKVAKPK
jgi:predicted transcriptional regulator